MACGTPFRSSLVQNAALHMPRQKCFPRFLVQPNPLQIRQPPSFALRRAAGLLLRRVAPTSGACELLE